MDLTEAEAVAARVDRLLKPVAERPVDWTDPEWHTKIRVDPPPEAADALAALVSAYEKGDGAQRDDIRRIFRKYRYFRWGVGFLRAWRTAEELRDRLLLISAEDQGDDTRDVIVYLNDLCTEARGHGIDAGPVLREIAALSSDVDHYGMGSMREILLRFAG
jgi:hypothetical protein